MTSLTEFKAILLADIDRRRVEAALNNTSRTYNEWEDRLTAEYIVTDGCDVADIIDRLMNYLPDFWPLSFLYDAARCSPVDLCV